jgi:Lipocalin-like domain
MNYPLGNDVTGMLMYDAHGQMSVHLMRPGRPKFARAELQGGTPEETLLAFNGYIAYYGRVTVDEARHEVTHHLAGATLPNWVGTTLTRTYRIEGRRVTLSTPPMAVSGQSLTSVLVWERVP